MKRVALIAGMLLAAAGGGLAAAPLGMTGHMAGHMVMVAVAAPALAVGLAGGGGDPALRWPAIVTPLAMSVIELAVVWSWHLPALRAAAAGSAFALALEQASFLAAGVMLWSAAFASRAGGVAALLLTSMHMTLLGALIGLSPRPLYPMMAHGVASGLDPLVDQQLGGVVMLMIGAASYLLGGLALLATVLRHREVTT